MTWEWPRPLQSKAEHTARHGRRSRGRSMVGRHLLLARPDGGPVQEHGRIAALDGVVEVEADRGEGGHQNLAIEGAAPAA